MAGERNPERLSQQSWWNIAVGFTVWMLTVVMPASLMPILYVPIMEQMGWSRGEVTAFSSFKFGAGAAIAFFMGHIIDRVGLNASLLTSFVGVGLSIASLWFVDSLWSYYLAAAVLGAAILGSVTGIKVLISRWFSERLGFAMGLALAGGGVAGVFVPPAATYLNALIGWRWTTVAMSSTIFVILIPLYLWKAQAGLDPSAAAPDLRQGRPVKSQIPDEPEFKALLATRTFWVLFVAHVIVGAVDHAMLDHLPLFIARDVNLGLSVAAWGFTIVTVAGALGKIGFGWLFDRYSIKAVALCWASMAAGIALAFPVAGFFTFALFTVARGASHGGVMVDIPICAKHVFGARSLSKTIAVFGAASSVGAAIATGGVGFMYDALQSYAVPFMILIGLSLLAGAMAYRVEPTYWTGRQSAQPQASVRAS